ncbi:MAG: hypothetical protein JNK67_11475 [Alphaproteobacteria bacterium]|nr:hypothetical protein [Alphaproteobacteria bacterium]
MRMGWTLCVAVAFAGLALDASAQERAAPRRAGGATLLTVETDAAASCRVVDAHGGSRTKEFGAPATVALASRQAGDQVVCVRDGRETRAAVPAAGRRVALTLGGATTLATPVRRLVTTASVHPYPGAMRLTARAEQDLVWLRQRYEEGAISERDYFARRREVIARGAVLEPARAPRRTAAAQPDSAGAPATAPRPLAGRGTRAG